MLAICIAPASARTLLVGAGHAYALPSLAAADAHDGDRIVIASGVYNDCAVITANDIVVEGAQDPAATSLDGKACQGKAALVAKGSNVTIRYLTLANIHVPDGNGAGIRAEGKDLTVDHVRFLGNENGILAGGNEASTITIRDSEFTGNGACIGDCAHGVYAGRIRLLRIERTRFFETHRGHHIKSRALHTEIIDCDISDGVRGNSSYLIDIPSGGALLLRGSKLEKGPLSENHTAAIMIGAEGVTNPTTEIRIENNEFRNDGAYDTYFVDNRTLVAASLSANRISGRTATLNGPGDAEVK